MHCHENVHTNTSLGDRWGWGQHLRAFSKALIKGMAEHTEKMGKEREKNNSWGLAKAECCYHKFMSARFEAFPRQWDDAKWLVLLPRVFVPVYLCAQCCCFSVCTHACIILSVSPPPTPLHLYSEGWTLADYVSAFACVRHIQNLGENRNILKKIDSLIVLLFSWTGKSENELSICSVGWGGFKALCHVLCTWNRYRRPIVSFFFTN